MRWGFFLLIFNFLVVLDTRGSEEIKPTKHLRILTWDGYAPRQEVNNFIDLILKKYSIKIDVSVDYVSSSDQFFNFVRAGMYDVIVPSHNLIHDPRYKFIEKELIIPINIESITNIKSLISGIMNLGYLRSDSKLYSIPLTYGPYGLAYDSSVISTPPESWNVLWDPAYKGKYTINSDYYEANIYITALAMGIDRRDIHKIDALSNKEFHKKLRYLVKNSSRLWSGVDSAQDLIGNSLATSWGFSFPELALIGKKWKMASPKEGTTMWIDGHSLTFTLKHDQLLKKIAEEWINYTLSDGFQYRAIVKGISSSPININVAIKSKDELLFSPPPIPGNTSARDYFLWPKLTIRERNYLKRLWKKALKD